MYIGDGTGKFSFFAQFFGPNPRGGVHPRKALPGDFNGDGKIDVFVLDSGHDVDPFPGSDNFLILSSERGYMFGTGLEGYVGYHHGGASADIDADGDVDVFVVAPEQSYFLINDGGGSFTRATASIQGVEAQPIYTAELVDVDSDGYVDLLVAGHEFEGFDTQILWGDRTGIYSTSKRTLLPEVVGYGIVVDIDVSDTDMDGDKDIVLNRVGDPTRGRGPPDRARTFAPALLRRVLRAIDRTGR